MPQFNAFRNLLSLTPVLHLQCFGYPHIIIIVVVVVIVIVIVIIIIIVAVIVIVIGVTKI